MAKLHAELRATKRSGRPRVVVVSAEPGLGKTRLAEEFARRLSGVTVLSGRCAAFGQRRPLAALADAVGSAVDLEGRGARSHDVALARLARRISGGDSAALARDLSLLLGVGQPVGRRPDAVEGAVRAARAALEYLATERPVLVIIDDLHWADADLIRTIESVHGGPWRGPILFLCLSRPEVSIEGVATVLLEPLDEHASLVMAERVLGADVPPLLGELLSRAGGNPLYLEESLGMLADAGSLVQESGGWRVARPEDVANVPTTIRLLIAARLDGLPPEDKRVIQDASVAGDVVWDLLLDEVSDVEDVRASIRSLETRDLFRKRRTSRVPGAVEVRTEARADPRCRLRVASSGVRVERHLEIASWLRIRWSEGRAGRALGAPLSARLGALAVEDRTHAFVGTGPAGTGVPPQARRRDVHVPGACRRGLLWQGARDRGRVGGRGRRDGARAGARRSRGGVGGPGPIA